MGGLEICCGARAVRHFLLGHPTITLSHFAPFLGEQSHRQALQFPIFADPAMSLFLSCFVGSISGSLGHRGFPSPNRRLVLVVLDNAT